MEEDFLGEKGGQELYGVSNMICAPCFGYGNPGYDNILHMEAHILDMHIQESQLFPDAQDARYVLRLLTCRRDGNHNKKELLQMDTARHSMTTSLTKKCQILLFDNSGVGMSEAS